MDENFPLPKRMVPWLISPGVLKFAAFVVGLSLVISYLSRLKADQIAARRSTPVHRGWTHGTSDPRLQEAIDRDDAEAVARLLAIVPRNSIRDNVVDRLSFDKTSRSLEVFLDKGWTADGCLHNDQPLMNAVRSGQPKALLVLLKHGADPNAVDDAKRSPMVWASGGYRTNTKVIEILAKYGAKVDEMSPFLVRLGSLQAKARLIRARPLAVAAMAGNLAGVRKLIQLGARVNRVPGEDLPPLVAAAFAKHPYEQTKWLLDHGADPNAVAQLAVHTANGWTADQVSAVDLNAHFEQSETVKLLLDHGAHPPSLAASMSATGPDTGPQRAGPSLKR